LNVKYFKCIEKLYKENKMISYLSPHRQFSVGDDDVNISYPSPPRLQRDTRIINRRIVRTVLNQTSSRRLLFDDITVDNQHNFTQFHGPFNCSICITEEEHDTPGKKLACNHVFHTHCIHAWFNSNHNTCPNCRAIVLDTN
jgi:hypothetical protein